ncbi:MAG: hypothetical protein ABF629_10515 [Sporolactobacillus sp.]
MGLNNERLDSMAAALGAELSPVNITDLEVTADAFLDGSIDPKELGVERCMQFTEECRSAINSLEKKVLSSRAAAGFSLMQGKTEQYKELAQEIEQIESRIEKFSQFI